MIYLDYAANTPADERVLDCFCRAERRFFGNANAHHAAGVAARDAMSEAVAKTAALVGAQPNEVVFVSGASEANNLAIKGVALAAKSGGRHIISTPLEHASATGSLAALKEQGFTVDLVRVTARGTVDLDHLKSLLREDTALVAMTAVDSELGAVQPVREAAAILRDYPDCRLHVDATQAVGRIPVSFDAADTMSLTAHKFYGLNGVGVLLRRRSVPLRPLIHGGASTTDVRSGTPAVALAQSLACALELADGERDARNAVVRRHNEHLRRALAAYPFVHINSPEDAVPHILNLSVEGVKGTVFQRELDKLGVCVSVKSACSSDGLPSAAVMAVCGDRRRALSSWRVSLSHLTTDAEIDGFLDAFDRVCRALVKDWSNDT